jgi:hypothetical protein
MSMADKIMLSDNMLSDNMLSYFCCCWKLHTFNERKWLLLPITYKVTVKYCITIESQFHTQIWKIVFYLHSELDVFIFSWHFVAISHFWKINQKRKCPIRILNLNNFHIKHITFHLGRWWQGDSKGATKVNNFLKTLFICVTEQITLLPDGRKFG